MPVEDANHRCVIFGLKLIVESTDYLNFLWTYLINILKYPSLG